MLSILSFSIHKAKIILKKLPPQENQIETITFALYPVVKRLLFQIPTKVLQDGTWRQPMDWRGKKNHFAVSTIYESNSTFFNKE